MLSIRDFASGLKKLQMDPAKPVLVHASLTAFGEIRGGTESVLGALLANQPAVMTPAFTYRTMLIPEEGPEDNGCVYGQNNAQNLSAEFYKPDMAADPGLGELVEVLRKKPTAQRSSHPILSFAGVRVEAALHAQALSDPLAPIAELARQGGWVLLMGVSQAANTSLYYAEKLAGRKQFVRWALTYEGVRECIGFPGCGHGFDKAAMWLERMAHNGVIGDVQVQAFPLAPMLDRIVGVIRQDPKALMCDRPDCEVGLAARRHLQQPAAV